MRNKKITSQKFILYLINELKERMEGKKKLMKLMFLIEHYNFNTQKLSKRGRIGNTFLIYRYGVFSFEIMEYVDDLINKGFVKDGFPLKSNKPVNLTPTNEKLLKRVIGEFGEKSGNDLEVETLRMMKIDPYDKIKYFGKEIKEIL